MELKCKLIEKSFKDDEGQNHAYYVLSFDLADGSNLEISVKGDKAKLLKLSNNLNDKMPDNDFWNK